MTTPVRGEDWRHSAACAGADTSLFFAAGSRTDDAVRICLPCPVRAECLHEQLEREAEGDRCYGVWGGLTVSERRALPALPTVRGAAIGALRELLGRLEDIEIRHEPTERTPVMDNTQPTPRPAEPKQEPLPVGQLLAWAAEHTDAKIRKASGQARDALDTLRARHHTEEQMKSLDDEAAALEARLAKLREQKAALAPARSKAPVQRDYKPADVRAWATGAGIELAPHGRIPQPVVDSWRAAGAPIRQP
jgi:hypothetical protein